MLFFVLLISTVVCFLSVYLTRAPYASKRRMLNSRLAVALDLCFFFFYRVWLSLKLGIFKKH